MFRQNLLFLRIISKTCTVAYPRIHAHKLCEQIAKINEWWKRFLGRIGKTECGHTHEWDERARDKSKTNDAKWVWIALKKHQNRKWSFRRCTGVVHLISDIQYGYRFSATHIFRFRISHLYYSATFIPVFISFCWPEEEEDEKNAER